MIKNRNTPITGDKSPEASEQFLAKLKIREGETSDYDIEFNNATAALEGYVTRDGIPIISGGDVRVAIQTKSGKSFFSQSVDNTGYYSFEGLPGGSAEIAYWYEGDADMVMEKFQTEMVDAHETHFDLELNTGSATLEFNVMVEWEEPEGLLILYEGTKDRGQPLGAGFYAYVLDRFESDVRYIAALNDTRETTLSVTGLKPGPYSVYIAKLSGWFFLDNFMPSILDHITLKENESLHLDYLIGNRH